MEMAGSPVRFAGRFRGPPGAANGGYACGTLAARLDGAAEVTLRRPVPLERPLLLRDGDGVLLLEDEGQLCAEARVSTTPVGQSVPRPPTLPEAHAAAGRAAYYDAPVFPGCFGCGPGRAPGDGLRIFPGPVPGREVLAAPWSPDPSVGGPDGLVPEEVVWAALDCPGGVAVAEALATPADGAALLGRMTARLDGPVRIGTAHRVVAWLLERDGRKHVAGSALFGPDDELLAVARAVWITVPRAALPAVPTASDTTTTAGGGPA
jgi:acyl-CoA thioesterase FadM